jgi:acyl-CoA reductase-like NAD-dependent aldehyde dehydrogenase
MVAPQVSMTYPLILAGKELSRTTFTSQSSFYPEYTYQLASARSLDVASAIGAARQAERGTIAERIARLEEAAGIFSYSQEDIEHAVRMTGMPIRLVSGHFAEIPEILRSIPRQIRTRFSQIGHENPFLAEKISAAYYKALIPNQGFCYAITPGNDPRATAIVAANLACLGIPFILRASIRDAAALLVVRALNASGFDARFAQLLYLDREDTQANQNHAHLVDASSVVWTFGPPAIIDRTLRYRSNPPRASVSLEGVDIDPADLHALHALLVEWGPGGLDRRLHIETNQVDLFAGKTVLRHASGNCAAITCGPFSDQTRDWLYASLGYAIVCTATKSVMLVQGENWISQAADFLESLVVGDPLNPHTQVGYIESRCLDYVEELYHKHLSRATFLGGQRLSSIQAAPLLVHSQADLPEFFAQEIPAYLLAIRQCQDLPEAIAQINRFTTERPRLAVSIMNFPQDLLSEAVLNLHAHTILIDRPSSSLLPSFHEGNDYTLLLAQGRFIAF